MCISLYCSGSWDTNHKHACKYDIQVNTRALMKHLSRRHLPNNSMQRMNVSRCQICPS